MADVSITDLIHLTGSVSLSDQSPLSFAGLKKLNFATLPVVGDLNKPIDQFPLDNVAVGLGLNLPSVLFNPSIQPVLGGGTEAALSVLSSRRGTLFDDEFSPSVRIDPGQCWAALDIKFSLNEAIEASSSPIPITPTAVPPSGFGVKLAAQQSISLGTCLRFPLPGTSALPSFKDGLAALLQSYSVPSPAEIRALPPGIAHTTEVTGSASVSVSYAAPMILNPLATLGLPFNFSLNVQPGVQADVTGSVAIEGSFAVRAYKSADQQLVFGLYKKKETTLSASLNASAGVGSDIGTTDILAKVLNLVPAPDLTGLQLTKEQTDELNKGLKESVDHSIALALNACCTASDTDEAAVVYELDLSGRDFTQIDEAITAAFHGDWTKFETLPTARPVRNIVRELKERKHKILINLLGLYNASSISDYLKSTTVLHDEHGQIVLTSKDEAKSLSAGTATYAAKTDKLRSALAQSFIATISYGASKGKLSVQSFAVQQAYLKYQAKASASDLVPEVLLARSVDLVMSPAWDDVLKSKAAFKQNKFFLNTAYNLSNVMRLFYADVENRIPYSAEFLDGIGRDTKIKLLDPSNQASMPRRKALSDDNIWNAMTKLGNTAVFSSIPGLARLPAPALAAISADFLDIRWWSNALQSVIPKLTAVLTAIENSTSSNPLDNSAFMTAQNILKNTLSQLQSQTQSAFGDGWPIAVMYRLAASSDSSLAPSVEMDIGWNGKFEHYEKGGKPR